MFSPNPSINILSTSFQKKPKINWPIKKNSEKNYQLCLSRSRLAKTNDIKMSRPCPVKFDKQERRNACCKGQFYTKMGNFYGKSTFKSSSHEDIRHILFNDFLHKNHIRSIVTIRPRHSAYYFFSFSKKCLQMHKCGGQS